MASLVRTTMGTALSAPLIAPRKSVGPRPEVATDDHAPVPSHCLALQETLARELAETPVKRWPAGLRIAAIMGSAGLFWVGVAYLVAKSR